MEGQKRAKLDMGVFLEQLRRMVVEDNSLERMVARCANGAANYLELLGRTYILFDCIQRGKQDDFAHQMQCRAKDTSNSSMIQQPRALYKLMVGMGMHRLRFLAPTGPDTLLRLLNSRRCLEAYMDDHPEELEWWMEEDGVQPTQAWFLGV